MSNITQKTKVQHLQKSQPVPAMLENELVTLFSLNSWAELECKARSASGAYPNHVLSWKALGKALIMQGKFTDAITPLNNAAKLSPNEADLYNDLGHIYEQLGQYDQSEQYYRIALKHNANLAEAHNNLAILLANQHRLLEAQQHYVKALSINPNSIVTYNNLGCLHRDFGQFQQALNYFLQAVKLNPQYFDAWFNLGLTQANLEQFNDAQQSYLQALTLNPNADIVLEALGSLLNKLGEKDDVAEYCLQRALQINPDNPESRIAYGNLLMRTARTTEAIVNFARAKELRPLITRPANKPIADFSVLLIDTPLAGCTPVDYLLDNAAYNANFYCLLAAEPKIVDLLKTNCDVVVNIISDADNGKSLFPLVVDIVQQLDCPIINHPTQIMHTNRENIAKVIANISGLASPKTRQFSGNQLLNAFTNHCLAEFDFPVLVRLAGHHGGDNCDKCHDYASIANFVAANVDQIYYVSEFIDYRSEDGFFRKYRLIYVNGNLLPYHLAIHNDWLVHYFRTEMHQHAWMQTEEEAFLKNFDEVFNQPHQTALKTLAAQIGLDYFGIDCSFDKHDNVLVFEANATMRVHAETNPIFAYKNPYISKIKDGFNSMLAKRVRV